MSSQVPRNHSDAGIGAAPRAPGATMADVARLAGVSAQTVSRVLNGHPSVSESVRGRVERAIRQLGYRRNTSARALRTRRTMQLGVIAAGLSQYGPSVAMGGISDAARDAGYGTSLVNLVRIDRETMRAGLDELTTNNVDGIIVIAPITSAATSVAGLSSAVPLVMFEPGADNGTTHVSIDEFLGARLATRHLLEQGHRTVWHLSGPAGWLGTDARIDGWERELAAWSRPAPEPVAGEWSAESGYRAAQQLLARSDVTAVFAANDQMALGFLRALHERQRRVPDQVSVVGFDDTPEAAYFQPPLTTVQLDFAELGRSCVQRLLALIRGETLTPTPALAPHLAIRKSTAPPPAD